MAPPCTELSSDSLNNLQEKIGIVLDIDGSGTLGSFARLGTWQCQKTFLDIEMCMVV